MGIRFKADHLTCPACGAACTPLNRQEPSPEAVVGTLIERFPTWDPDEGACEQCISDAYRQVADQGGLFDRIRTRFRSQPETQSVHRYRTTELV